MNNNILLDRSLILLLFVASIVLFDYTENTNIINIVFLILSCFCIPFYFKVNYSKATKLSILFSFWCVCSVLWSIDTPSSITRAITCCLMTLILISIETYKNKGDYIIERIIKVYIICTLILSVVAYFQSGAGNFLIFLATEERLGGEEFLNSNMLGKYFAICGIACLYFSLSKKKPLYWILFIITVAFTIITRSRSSLLSLVLGALFFFYFYCKSINNLKLFIRIIICLVIIVIGLASMNIWGDAFLRLLGMVDFFVGTSYNQYEDASTAMREMVILDGLMTFPESPIFGQGIGSATKVLYSRMGASVTEYYHNNYVQLLVETGVVGFLLFYSIIIHLLKKLWKTRTNSISVLLLSILLVFIISDTNNTTYYHKLYYLFLGIIVLHNETNQRESRKKSKGIA